MKHKAAHATPKTWAPPWFSGLLRHMLHFKHVGRLCKVRHEFLIPLNLLTETSMHEVPETRWKQLLLPIQRSNAVVYLWAWPSTASTSAVWPAPASSPSAGSPGVWRTATLPCAPLLALSHTTNPAAPRSSGTRHWSPPFPMRSQCSPGLSCSSPAPAWSFHKCSASGHHCWPRWWTRFSGTGHGWSRVTTAKQRTAMVPACPWWSCPFCCQSIHSHLYTLAPVQKRNLSAVSH